MAAEVAAEKHVRTLVINWWSFASDVTKEVFGEDGGHAGWNETAMVQAIDRTLVHPERYSDKLATAYPAPGHLGRGAVPVVDRPVSAGTGLSEVRSEEGGRVLPQGERQGLRR